MRLMLFVLVMITVILWPIFVWAYWEWLRPWLIRVVLASVWPAWIYVLIGQTKAYDLHIPFDGTSWLGLYSFLLLDAVLSLALYVALRLHIGKR